MTVSANYALIIGSLPPQVDDGDELPHALEQETSHALKGISRFIEQYKEKPRMEQWARSYLIEIQALEDAFWQIYTMRWIDSATGEQLVVLGEIVGQYNPGLSEENYRVLIRARIAVNRSNGRPDELIDILALLSESFAEPAVIMLVEGLTADYTLNLISDIGSIDPDIVFGLMLDHADPAGVAANFVFGFDTTDDLFIWSSASGGTLSYPDQGFDSSVSPGVGGILSGARGSA